MIGLTFTDVVTPAEDATVVGYVHSGTTLICDRSFYNYPEWTGPNGIDINYMYDETINPNLPFSSRLKWASNKRDLIITDIQKSDAGTFQCSVPDTASYMIGLKVRGILHTMGNCLQFSLPRFRKTTFYLFIHTVFIEEYTISFYGVGIFF